MSETNKQQQTPKFTFYPKSFGTLPVAVQHMDLLFDIFDDHTRVTSDMQVQATKAVSELTLNAKNLEINKVSVSNGDCSFTYDTAQHQLIITFSDTITEGTVFTIHTETICRPTYTTLEGLYFDVTPEGAPPTQITQCQQWGFQRIVPCFDDMTAKCTYRTTIIADSRYTNIITNGDIAEPRQAIEEGRDRVVYENMITPMAPYLFFLGVGTYRTFTKHLTYADGTAFMLELLVHPESDTVAAQHALEILHDGIQWIHLFTGPDMYANRETAEQILKLMRDRENGEEVQATINDLLAGRQWGYQYTGSVYREIAMQNSDVGGMENVGNTTITANRIMPFAHITDGAFEYMIRVKVHEFYHNLNGSEVTGMSPFEIWLNEAATVFMEAKYHAYLFGSDYSRLDTVLMLLAPAGGTFAGDDHVASKPIEPVGFNDPNELITGVTYSKAPEFVRMIETLMGKESFAKGLNDYHTRFAHSNASRAQWVASMERQSGLKLQRFSDVWLKQRGYPKVNVRSTYDHAAKTLTLTLEQANVQQDKHWEFPFHVALFDTHGTMTIEKHTYVDSPKETITLTDAQEPAFISLNRGYTFFGKVFYEASDDALYLQAQHDTDIVQRFMAFYRLAEKEKLRLLNDRSARASDAFIELYWSYLNDEQLMHTVSAQLLTIFEYVDDPAFIYAYQDLYDVVRTIKRSIAEKHTDALMHLYKRYAALSPSGSYVEQYVAAMKLRQVKNLCLGLLATLDTQDVQSVIQQQFDSAMNATDKLTAFNLYMNTSAPDRTAMLHRYQTESESDPVTWENFLVGVARINSDDCVAIIQDVEKSPAFRIEQANDQRALFGVFAMNRKKSLLTESGRTYLKEKIVQLAPINEYNTSRMLDAMGTIPFISEPHRSAWKHILKDLLDILNPTKTPSVYGTLQQIYNSME